MGVISTAVVGVVLALLFLGFYAVVAESIALVLIILLTIGCMIWGFVLDYRQEARLATTR
jgi:hypothetical protein